MLVRRRPSVAAAAFGLAAATAAAAGSASAPPPLAAPEPLPPEILVSRQLLASERLTVGDVVALSADPSGANARAFRIAGSYEPVADPARLGERRLEARLHLADMLRLTAVAGDPLGSESVGAINVRLTEAKDAAAFAGELSARLPGTVVRSTAAGGRAVEPMEVLDRFHLAIAIVTVVGSSLFLLALMVMLVDERRGTVAVLRLIGLRRRRILGQVLLEGLLIALAGAAFGVALAAALDGVFNLFFQWRFDTPLVFVRVTPAIAWRSALLAVPLGVLAAVLSSWTLLRGDAVSLSRR